MNNNIFWIALTIYALHMMEEFYYDWKGWANNVLKMQVDWTGFYVTNMFVLFFGTACASVGWSNPLFSLTFPGLMLINALFFHILPVIVAKKFSPGIITACLLFLPLCGVIFKDAIELGVSKSTILGAVGISVLIMIYPVLLVKTKDLPFFNQNTKKTVNRSTANEAVQHSFE